MDTIPDEVLVHILSFASHSTHSVRLVCKKWKTIQDTDVGIHLHTKRGHVHGMKLASKGNWKLLSAEIPIASCSIPMEPLVEKVLHRETILTVFVGDGFPSFPVSFPPQVRSLFIKGNMFLHFMSAIPCLLNLTSLDIRWNISDGATITSAFVENVIMSFAPNLEFLTLHHCNIDGPDLFALLLMFDKVGNRMYPISASGDSLIAKVALRRKSSGRRQ